MADITLESLIQEQRDRIPRLKYEPDPPDCFGLDYYYYKDNEEYLRWLATTKRYIGIKFPNDKDIAEFDSVSRKKLSPSQQKNLLAILEAFESLPNIIPNTHIMDNTDK